MSDIIDTLMDITTTEEVKQVITSLETPRPYKKLIAVLKVIAPETNANDSVRNVCMGIVDTGIYRKDVHFRSLLQKTGYIWGYAQCDITKVLTGFSASGSSGMDLGFGCITFGSAYADISREDNIEKLSFQVVDGLGYFGVGSMFKVYGVRA